MATKITQVTCFPNKRVNNIMITLLVRNGKGGGSELKEEEEIFPYQPTSNTTKLFRENLVI